MNYITLKEYHKFVNYLLEPANRYFEDQLDIPLTCFCLSPGCLLILFGENTVTSDANCWFPIINENAFYVHN